mmetsp:Transcript_289/g.783  ORF Transcript_289/g.783 Transcript_289/m.783 type:complete len:95 (+) Transcript_289:3110-3394(+)
MQLSAYIILFVWIQDSLIIRSSLKIFKAKRNLGPNFSSSNKTQFEAQIITFAYKQFKNDSNMSSLFLRLKYIKFVSIRTKKGGSVDAPLLESFF